MWVLKWGCAKYVVDPDILRVGYDSSANLLVPHQCAVVSVVPMSQLYIEAGQVLQQVERHAKGLKSAAFDDSVVNKVRALVWRARRARGGRVRRYLTQLATAARGVRARL